ncbi:MULTISPECIES: hypothetical protein [unclassified Rathayibacter]|uniref:hypothetical protein n=1 Tax=unclassified Rathayibacter TaxID=2609250 RepID=UPI00188C801F|nr:MULTISPECIES: hypothetical protein [unclassified Rathayibacter]MBF4461140.1 hypothetical protein [Rathayibacter sp. VKM Ac-2879]MBF4502551.1 hypothetical protein [Rathayibacter sp. VKM Ac-2878]
MATEGNFSKKDALAIHDESERYLREIFKTVAKAAGAVALGAAILIVLAVAPELQAGLPFDSFPPKLLLTPFSGATTVAGYGLLAGIIFTIRFGLTPSTTHRSREHIAREVASRRVLNRLAFGCTCAAILLGVMTVVTYGLAAGPERLDPFRTVAGSVLSLALATVAAEVAMRTEDDPNPALDWAASRRKRQRLQEIIHADHTEPLTRRAHVIQHCIMFLFTPLCLTAMGWWIAPTSAPLVVEARLLVTVTVSFLAYFLVSEIVYRLIGGRIWGALEIVIQFGLIGLLYWMASALPGLADQSGEVIHTAPIARGMLAVGLFMVTIPFMVAAVLSAARLPGGRRGLVFDKAMKKYHTALEKAVDGEKKAKRAARVETRMRDAALPVSAAAIAGAVMVFAVPFPFLFAHRALQDIRAGRARGRWLVITTVSVSAIFTVVVVGAIITFIATDPTLTWCSTEQTWICFGRT